MRRRILALALSGAGLLLGGAVAAPTVGRLHAARTPDARATVVAARGAAVRAEVRLAKISPADAVRIHRQLERAELFASVDPIGNWLAVLIEARRTLVALALERRDVADEWRELEPEAAAAVAQARRDRSLPGLGSREAGVAERAATALARARHLAASGDFARALVDGELAIAEATRVSRSSQALLDRFARPDLRRLWRQQAEATIAGSRRGVAIVVAKLERRLDVYRRGKRLASFSVELGSRGLHRKLHAGDRATPEGIYRVSQVKVGAQTKYYKALLLDYPSAEDRRRFELSRRRGEIPRGRGIGSLIEIHGDGGQGKDWTDGCVALTNADMDRLMAVVGPRTPVAIVGTLGEDG